MEARMGQVLARCQVGSVVCSGLHVPATGAESESDGLDTATDHREEAGRASN